MTGWNDNLTAERPSFVTPALGGGLLLCAEGGATLAACEKALRRGLIKAEDQVVLFNRATGLKYPMPDKSLRFDRHSEIDHASL